MPIICETYTAPDAWASYFINGDSSGLEAREIARADAWAESLPGPVVSTEEGDSWFAWRYDADSFCGYLGATVAAYTVHRQGTKEEAEADNARRALDAAQVAALEAEALADEDGGPEALEAQAKADKAEAAALARNYAAQANLGRLEALERARPVLEAQEGESLLSDVAPARGWHILAEAQGRRYYLGTHAFYSDAQADAAAWQSRYSGAWPGGVGLFLADTRRAAINGGAAELLAAADSRWSNRGPWSLVAWAWAGGVLVPIARQLSSGLETHEMIPGLARAWRDQVAAWWPGKIGACYLVNLGAGLVLDALEDESKPGRLPGLDWFGAEIAQDVPA